MDPIDRLVFEMNIEVTEGFRMVEAGTDKLEDIDHRAKRLGMEVDWKTKKLKPIKRKLIHEN
jgi:archaellum component FlaC